MSWDVVVLCRRGAHEGAGARPAVAVREALSASLPGLLWAAPDWGLYLGEEDEFCLEFELGPADPIDRFVVHVWGGGDPVPFIASICREHGFAAFDVELERFLDFERPQREGWRRFRKRRAEARLHALARSGAGLDGPS